MAWTIQCSVLFWSSVEVKSVELIVEQIKNKLKLKCCGQNMSWEALPGKNSYFLTHWFEHIHRPTGSVNCFVGDVMNHNI